MKNTRKGLVLLVMALFCSSLFLTGCAGKLEKPDVTGQILYDLYVLGDTSQVAKVGLSEDEAKTVIDKEKDAAKKSTKSNFVKAGVSINNSKLDEIIESQFDSFKKLSGKVEIVSESKDSVDVKISTDYIDVEAVDTKAMEEALSEVQEMGLTNSIEAKNKLIETYQNNIINKFKEASPSTDRKEETFTFTKQKFNVDGKTKEIWMPEDMKDFGEKMGKMITNNM